jgi:ornithine cyclodeaminase/alanine dehydrogenase-like protein (mu-crystallin family)
MAVRQDTLPLGETMITRREFLDALAVGAAGLAVGTTAKSYGQILGSNDRLNFAVIGLNGRAYAHLASIKANRSAARISHVCDVDGDILKKFAERTQQEMGEAPVAEKDFRRILEEKNVDAITIATPEHWHTPMAIAGLQAGKHVYVEKPCSHNPAEERCLWIAMATRYMTLKEIRRANLRLATRLHLLI